MDDGLDTKSVSNHTMYNMHNFEYLRVNRIAIPTERQNLMKKPTLQSDK